MRKKVITLLSIVIGIMFVTLATLMTLTLTVWKTEVSVEATQVDQTQNINVKWATTKGVDSVTINVNHNGESIYDITLRSAKDLLKGEYTVPAFYGRQSVSITVNRGLFKQTLTERVDVSTDEYVIAPLVATMPVTMFSLDMKNITNDYSIPTFVWLEREGAWNWSKLPENVYPMPFSPASSFTDSSFSKFYSKTSEWIKELYEINEHSFFHLYYNDLWSWGAIQATYANKLPAENYHLTLLSDGGATFSDFRKNFNNDETYEEVYASMSANWSALKTEVNNKGKYSDSIFESYRIAAKSLGEYSYIIASEEENVDWWVTRYIGPMVDDDNPQTNNVIKPKVNELVSEGKLVRKELGTLLNNLNAEEKAYIKELFKFSEDMYEKADQENKKIMIILGTWNENEENFDGYVKAVKAYYGDEYVYYYKGHPWSPTSTIPGKYAHLDELGLIDIESTISAELLFFFRPEIQTCGYDSSTFLSLNDEQTCGVFGYRKGSLTNDYAWKFDFYVTKADRNGTDDFKSLIPNDNSYVLEFVDTTTYDIAIYDATANTIKYYKQNAGTYQEVTL